MTLRTTGDTELTALVIAYHFFALESPAIPLLTLLKMTDFPFWISESRTSISEPVKSFFFRLDAVNTSWHRREEAKPYMVLFRAWGMQIYYIRAPKYRCRLFTQFFQKLRAFVESDVACSYETFLRKK